MTPEQALNVVAQMVAATPATYAEHTMAQQALVVLKGFIEAKQPDGPIQGGSTDG